MDCDFCEAQATQSEDRVEAWEVEGFTDRAWWGPFVPCFSKFHWGLCCHCVSAYWKLLGRAAIVWGGLRDLGEPRGRDGSNLARLSFHRGAVAEGGLRTDSTTQITMYSFMGGGLFCAWVGTILLVVATATDHWMQYRLSGSFAHQGLWRYCLGNKCFLQTESIAYWNATRAFMILSALCATSGIVMGVLAFAQQSTFTRLSRPFSAGIMFFASTLFVLLALAIYTGVTVSFLGRRFGDWRFSWSYILGWVALLMTFFAGIFYMCAYRMHECRRLSNPR